MFPMETTGEIAEVVYQFLALLPGNYRVTEAAKVLNCDYVKTQELTQETVFDPADAQDFVMGLTEVFRYNLFELIH